MTIGITGGIGSGKSFVSRLLAEHFGVPVYDCDREARRLMNESPTLRRQLTALVGADVYSPDGQLCKAAMIRYLFASDDHAAAVNAIVHPLVRQDFHQWAGQRLSSLASRSSVPNVVAVESALLVEAGMASDVDSVWLVTAPESLRIRRAMQRDGATEVAVRERMARQLPEDRLRQMADVVIENDGRDLLPQISELIHSLKDSYNHA
ncbi:MAG: dephospho-CoA kinase [Bacteroidaceae bacterium]|nr:dephospho-CoA kinase [Bacteroidaceae bacterium]